ncbi:MAG: MFS transporter [Chloroflexota bacterium]
MDKDQPSPFYGFVVAGAAFAVMVTGFGTLYSFGVFFTPLLAEFGWSRAVTSGAYSLCVVIYGLTSMATGRLADRFGPQRVITVCGIFLGLGYLLLYWVSSVWQLYLFYGFISLGMSGCWAPMVSLVARWFVRMRGMVTGMVSSGVGLGMVIVPPLVSWLVSAFYWRTAYLIIGITALTLVVVAAQFLRPDPHTLGKPAYGEEEERDEKIPTVVSFSFRQAARARQFWMVCLLYFFFSFVLQTFMVHVVPYAIGFNIPATQAAGILAVMGWCNFLSRPLVGMVTDRLGNKPGLVFGFLVTLASVVALLLARELWVFFLSAGLLGVAFGSVAALQSLVAAELFGLRSLGIIVGSFAFSFTLGGAVGPFVAGGIYDVTTNYQLAFLICIAASLLGLLASALLKPTAR